MIKSREILQEFWGFSEFRDKQEDIISNVLKGKDVLALLPTGGGKSICFQVPGIQMPGICIVISPLIALMHDQVENLKRKNIKAVAITSGMSKKEIDIALDNAVYGNYKFIYVSPERLKTNLFLSRFEKMNVNFVAIDEAHCISQWGYDFRPPYLEIEALRKIKPNLSFIALTATATSKVVEDIQEKLNFKERNVVQKSFQRDNLTYITLQTNNKLNRIIEFSKKLKGSGIVYCATRKATKDICKILLENGISANFYHGGLDQEQRSIKQNAWIKNEVKIMVATNAFGMGIDKPDVRFVLHYGIPESLEAYFQEAGRGGRDLKKSRAILFFEPNDIHELDKKIELKYPPIETIKKIYTALGNHFQLAIGSGKDETFALDFSEFADKYNQNLMEVYNSIKFLELEGLILLEENSFHPSKIKILADNFQLYQYQVKNPELNKIIQFILRSHMGAFDDFVPINEYIIAKKLQISIKSFLKHLQFLNENEVIAYSPGIQGTQITFLTERLDVGNFSISPKFYKERKEDTLIKINSVKKFLENKVCRNIFLLDYFGEKNAVKCGKCNVCLDIDESTLNQKSFKEIKNYTLETLKTKEESIEINDIIQHFKEISHKEVLTVLRWMFEHDLIQIDSTGKKIVKI